MALSRQEVFDIINAERNYQDGLWTPHDGQKTTEHCMSLVHIYLRKAEDAWNVSNGELTTWQQLTKIATIITRALEGGRDTEGLKKGLR